MMTDEMTSRPNVTEVLGCEGSATQAHRVRVYSDQALQIQKCSYYMRSVCILV